MEPHTDQREHAQEDPGNDIDDPFSARGFQTLPVVGLGGSAGAIAALQAFFSHLPTDTGMAFVVVMHLSPDHESMLDELLQRETAMPVCKVGESEPLEPNRVYVIPPRKGLQTIDGHLRLCDLPSDRTRRAAVDHFFRTLADSHGPNACAVVLSGGNADGAIGVKRIKERGGLTIAQDPGEAEHDGMPRAAIATGMVDWVLPIAQMPQRLIDYLQQRQRVRLPPEDHPPVAVPDQSDDDEALLREVLSFLCTRTGRDFSYYKRATILRRIGRRLRVNGNDDLRSYLDGLRTRPGEAGALLQDLLVSVTNFFRDSDSFVALEARIPRLFRDKGPTDVVRVWVVACASGEEAYSVAMLLSEHARTLDSPPLIQVFATDLDEDAIQVAREGVYPTTIEGDVSEERLRRFFVKEHRGYRVRRELRETVLFAVHDLLKDSPFSRLDLVTCRNLLIYLNREAQGRALAIFHFALRAGGTLFLGTSESVEDGHAQFAVLDKKHRLFRQRATPRAGLPLPSGPGMLALEPPQSHTESPHVTGRSFEQGLSGPRVVERHGSGRAVPWGEVHLRLLDQLAPPSVLVDTEYELLHVSPGAARFLQFNGGEPSRNLLRSVHPALRIELRAVLYQVSQSREPAAVPGIVVPLDGEQVRLTLRVYPARDVSPELLLVTFQAGVALPRNALEPSTEVPEPLARQLDSEIERLKAQLHDTVEQYEASTEELKASNEELQAMNEELRSATEELETGREELQSINEELTTVNQELKSKVDELCQANSDLHNLMDATAIATVFLDRQLRITRFTPSAVQLFNLIGSDVGRPLTDLKSQLRYPALGVDAQRVLETLVTVEREVGEAGDRWYLARLRPYRTLDDRIAGVVLTFVDITDRKLAQEALHTADARFRAIVNQASVGVVLADLQGRIELVNDRMCQLLQRSEAELVGMEGEQLIHPDELPGHRQRHQALLERHEPYENEKRLLRRDGSPVWVHQSVALLPATGSSEGAVISICMDITERQRAEAALRDSELRLRMVVENAIEYAIFTTDLERCITAWNPGAERILGHGEQQALGRSADMVFTEEDRAAGVPHAEAAQALVEGRAPAERRYRHRDGGLFWASSVLMLVHDAEGQPAGFVKLLRDQSEGRRARDALERCQAGLQQALGDKDAALAALQGLLRRGPPDGPVDLHQTIRSACAACATGLRAREQRLTLALDAPRHHALGDDHRLQQLVEHLLTNASRFTPPGGAIRLQTAVQDGAFVMTLCDNGIGIEAETLPRLFDAISPGGASVAREHGSLGLGLEISRSTAAAHGGRLQASSAGPGQGAAFTLTLPLADAR